MKFLALFLVPLGAVSLIACTAGQPPPESSPTQDIEATVKAGLLGTQTAESSIDATIQARVAATQSIPNPTATPRPMPPRPTYTPQPTYTPWPTLTPQPTPTPRHAPALSPALTPGPIQTQPGELAAYADRHANGPGAIYVGDLSQLAGSSVYPEFMPAYGTELGDDYGNVPLDAIMDLRWVFESNYYRQYLKQTT